MTKKMLIDATHAEETRVAVMDGTRLEEFDYESALRKPIKGNVYLAKVTRVEPSLQAAFVNYGGNRHGFLPFSEIHPDYFRIPVADREALMEEREALMKEHEEQNADNDDDIDDSENDEDDDDSDAQADEYGDEKDDDAETSDKSTDDDSDDDSDEDENIGNRKSDEDGPDGNVADNDDSDDDEKSGNSKDNKRGRGRGRGRGGRQHRSRQTQKKSRRDDWDPEERFRYSLRKRYKIQEVVKRGQIVLLQATKEERGNKGAAFTTYLSIPGRYCVLMPNSPRGGGVSRKIANGKDRNRMRDLLKQMTVPKGMSVILRTAGVERTKAEVNRDLDYLVKLWGTIREETLQSSAPALIYEEANLIKRTIRDGYTRDIKEVIVSGEKGYKTARNFMKMMIPSHVKKIIQHDENGTPLFSHYKAERQIADIGDVQVTLPSGGYLVINPTEALVSVDVNSGRATKERHIEETALKTNLEAADEVARQLRLRDLGGLVVIDFIDMENRRNNGKVERRMRDALSNDRARVQNSRISSFGLMELSRQRLSPSLTESQYETCDHCSGLGRVRSADGTSVMVIRAIEDEGQKRNAAVLTVQVRNAVALYILNHKRGQLAHLEERYGFKVLIEVNEDISPSSFNLNITQKRDKDDEDDQATKQSHKSNAKSSRNRKSNRDDQADEKSDKNEDASSSEKDDESGDKKSEKPRRTASRRKSSKDDAKSDIEKSDATDDKDENADKKKPVKRTRRATKKKDEGADDVKKSDNGKSDKDDEEKPKKAAAKKSSSTKKTTAKSQASNDDKPKKTTAKKSTVKKKDEPQEASKHETVNEAPKKKKKGWWSI